MIFEEVVYVNNVYNTNEKSIYFIKLDEDIKICKIEDTEHYILVRDIKDGSNTYVLNKNDKYRLKIIGRLEKIVRSY